MSVGTRSATESVDRRRLVRTADQHAIQIADRWHLWHILGRTTENAVRRLRPHWPPSAPEPASLQVPAVPDTIESAKIRERHAAVHALGDKA